MTNARVQTWAFALLLVLLSLALHARLLPQFSSALPSDPGDPLLNLWILWWNAHSVPFTAQYWNAPSFAPAPYAFALSETLLGLTWVSTPLQWLGASPLEAYNAVVVVTPVLNGLSAFWLCLTLTGRRDAAAVGGLFYAFAPYHASQLAHVQTQALFWMPLALVGLHRYWGTGGRWWLACFGAAVALNGLTCGYFLLFFGVFVGIAVVWLVLSSREWAKITPVLVALGLAALVLAPVALTYRQVQADWNLSRGPQEIESLWADVLALFVGADRLLLWPFHAPEWLPVSGLYPQYPGVVVTLLLAAGAVVAIRARRPAPSSSPWRGTALRSLAVVIALTFAAGAIYWLRGPWALSLGPLRLSVTDPYKPIGLGMNLLLVAAMLTPRFAALVRSGSLAGLYATGAVMSFVLALGPVGRVLGERFWYKPPYAWLMQLPGFASARVPALFVAITVLCVAVLAALAIARLAPRVTMASRVAIAVVAAAIVLDGWATVPVVAAPQPMPVTITGDLVIELPRQGIFGETAAMYRGIEHGRPVLNGYSGFDAPHYWPLMFDIADGCFDSLDAARGGRSLDVVIWRGLDETSRVDSLARARWGDSVRVDALEAIVYHLPRAPAASPLPAVDASIDLRGLCSATRAVRRARGTVQ